MVIDARNKLKPEHISQFLEACDKFIIIDFSRGDDDYATIGKPLKEDFVEMLLSFTNLNDSDSLICYADDDAQLLITGMDINWWKDNARRYNKLYKAAEEALSKESVKTYCIGIATLTEGSLSQVKVVEGDKDTIVSMLNDDIKRRYIDSFLKSTIVLDIDYQEGDENNIPIWLTLDELVSLGVFTLQ